MNHQMKRRNENEHDSQKRKKIVEIIHKETQPQFEIGDTRLLSPEKLPEHSINVDDKQFNKDKDRLGGTGCGPDALSEDTESKKNVSINISVERSHAIGGDVNAKVLDNCSTEPSRHITFHDEGSNIKSSKSESTEIQSAVEVKKICTNCPENPYIICDEPHNTIVNTWSSNPPKFIKEIIEFTKLYKVHSSLQIHCSNCCSGPMNDWTNLIKHLVGRTHASRSGTSKNLRIYLCSTCFKVKCCLEELSNIKNWPSDLNPIFFQIFPHSTVKRDVIVEEEKSKELNLPKITPKSVNIIIPGVPPKSKFSDIFDSISSFGKNHELDLEYLAVVEKTPKSIAFCKYVKHNGNFETKNVSRTIKLNNVFINIEVTSSFNDTLNSITSSNERRSLAFQEWTLGTLAPTCEIFGIWNDLLFLVDMKLREMASAESEFHNLALAISSDLRRCLSGCYRIESIYFFGSRVTGLALKYSDFDLQLSIEGKCSVRDISVKCLNRSHYFIVKEVIPWAKVPIMKLLHSETQCVCDVSLNNMNGVINSRLIRFYLDIDERVKWLVVTVKIWASMNHISGSFMFKSYTIVWLVLFFLMQKDVDLVPNVRTLLTLPASDNRFTLETEEGMTLSLDMKNLHRVHNPVAKCSFSRFQLIVLFFKFCIDYMSSKDVLNPFTGQRLTREYLIQLIDLRNADGNLNNVKSIKRYSMIIMDPIKHSFNISAAVKTSLMDNFISLAHQTLELLFN